MRTRLPALLLRVFGTSVLVWLASVSPCQAAGSIRLRVQPDVILADGNSTATVSAEVRDQRGQPARDGTEVRFVTTAGTVPVAAVTSAGVARVTLTSSSVPASALITAYAGAQSAVVRVQMVSRMVEANTGGRVLRMKGNYVAYSEDRRYLEATQGAQVRFRGLTVEANGIQIEITGDLLRAFGSIRLRSGEKQLEGERLLLNLSNFDGYLLGPHGRMFFNGYGLNPLPERPKTLVGDFEFADLSQSTLLWVGKEAVYIPGEVVQLRGARAYVGGIKALRMPYHQSNLQEGFGEGEQYLGAGTEGLIVDIPFYLQMGPSGSTALRIRNGERLGFGYFGRRPGFGLDLEQKYGITGRYQGTAMLNQITSGDWGFHWDHTQQLGQQTRLFTQFDAPRHRDLFGQLNLSHRFSFGAAHLNLSANKYHGRSLGRTLDLSFQTRPQLLWQRRLRLSLEARHTDVQAGQFERAFNRKFEIPQQTNDLLGLRLSTPSIPLTGRLSLNSSFSVRQMFGSRSGFGFGFTSGLNARLPGNGSLNLNYTFNEAQPYRTRLNSATQTLSGQLSWRQGNWRTGLFGTMGLGSEQQTLAGRISYQLTPSWRLDLLPTYYRFGEFARTDNQFGVARSLGSREIILYWSTGRHRLLFELGASNF
ncbi:MAG: hypothetical protein HY320_06540 [Armatimonadetes bacterium]|nr:hypothetical protein [Armatimonadota bacterium]